MRLLLVRHAPTPETGSILTGRAPGIALSEEGRGLAAAQAAHLCSLPIKALYTSPVQRCRETAAIFGAEWGVSPVAEPGIIEAEYGRWSGRRLASLHKLKAWRVLMASPGRFRFPEGETLREVQSRAVAAAEAIASKHRRQHVAIVSHADVIRVILSHYLGSPLDLLHRLDVRPLGVSIVDLPDDGGPPRVPVVNSGLDPSRV